MLVKVVIVFLVVGWRGRCCAPNAGPSFLAFRAGLGNVAFVMAAPAAAYYLWCNPARSTEYFLALDGGPDPTRCEPTLLADWLGFAGGWWVSFRHFPQHDRDCPGSFRTVRWLLMGIWAGYLVYGLALPFQMFTHSYYHLQLVPIVALGLVSITETVSAKAGELGRGPGRQPLLIPLLVLIGYEAWAARSALIAEDFDDAPRFWETVGRAIPADSNVIALTQDYGFDLMYWGWRKPRFWPLNTNLSDFRNGKRDLAARFTELTSDSDYFLVTAFGQLGSQPGLTRHCFRRILWLRRGTATSCMTCMPRNDACFGRNPVL